MLKHNELGKAVAAYVERTGTVENPPELARWFNAALRVETMNARPANANRDAPKN